jgi:3-hydroxymyristoyl/3-hydroxydecanoyl-(acyl carrier protein) dehydratase
MTAGGGEAFRQLGFAVLPGAIGEAGNAGVGHGDNADNAHNDAHGAGGADGVGGSEAGRPGHAGRDSARAQAEVHIPSASALVQAEFEIPPDSPLFEGHFPGKPILPGIAHLALVQRALIDLAAWRTAAEAGGAGESSAASIRAAGLAPAGGRAGAVGTEIVAVRNLRLRLPVNPGDRLALRLTAHAGGSFRFDLRRGAELVSQGEVRAARNDGAWPSPPREPGINAALSAATIPPEATEEGGLGGPKRDFPLPADLLPHAPPARLLRAVLAAGAGGIVCAAVVPASHPLAVNAKAPGFLGLEIAAQAAACLEALRRPRIGAPPIGYLVGVRHAHLAPTLPCDTLLQVRAIPAGNAAALTIYDFEVHLAAANPNAASAAREAGELLAAGTLSTYLLLG